MTVLSQARHRPRSPNEPGWRTIERLAASDMGWSLTDVVLWTTRWCMRIKLWRLKRRLTQQALADKAAIHRVYLAQLEAGTKTPSLHTLRRLAKTLRVKVAVLLE